MTAVRAILADLHLGYSTGDLDRFSHHMARVRARGAHEVVFLGDLFRALVGLPRFWDATVEAGLAELASLRRAGCRVVILEGNREFFLDSRHLDPYRDRSGLAHSFTAGGRRFLLEHGDLLNRRDRQYLFWRSLSKGKAARLCAHILPRFLARRIVTGTERQLAKTNFTYRTKLPVALMETGARRHFRAGVDVVLWGHFHRGWHFRDGTGEAFVVPAWQETETILWIDDDGTIRFDPPIKLGQNGHGTTEQDTPLAPGDDSVRTLVGGGGAGPGDRSSLLREKRAARREKSLTGHVVRDTT